MKISAEVCAKRRAYPNFEEARVALAEAERRLGHVKGQTTHCDVCGKYHLQFTTVRQPADRWWSSYRRYRT